MVNTKDRSNKTGYIYREAIIKKLSDNYQNRHTLIAANFNKVSSSDLTQLRQSLSGTDAKLFLTKLSLFKRFLKTLEKDALLAESVGSAGLIFAGEDIVAISKLLWEFSKEHENFKILGVFMEERKLSSSDIERISKLPGRQELIAKAVLTIKSPLIRLRATIEQPIRKLLLGLTAAKQKKEKQVTGEPKQQ